MDGRLLFREGVEGVDEPGQAVAGLGGRQSAQGFQDGPDAVPGHGRAGGGGAVVHEGVEGGGDVEVGGLEPVGQLLVGEAVAASGGDEQPFGEDGGGPAGAPGEQFLEGGPVQLPLPGAEAPPGGLVHPPGHPRRQPPHPGPTNPHPTPVGFGATTPRSTPGHGPPAAVAPGDPAPARRRTPGLRLPGAPSPADTDAARRNALVPAETVPRRGAACTPGAVAARPLGPVR